MLQLLTNKEQDCGIFTSPFKIYLLVQEMNFNSFRSFFERGKGKKFNYIKSMAWPKLLDYFISFSFL